MTNHQITLLLYHFPRKEKSLFFLNKKTAIGFPMTVQQTF